MSTRYAAEVAWETRAGNWTRLHLTEDYDQTLCGRQVPELVAGGTPKDECRTCAKRWKEEAR